MVDIPFILTFGSCGWNKIFRKNDDGTQELIYEEEGRKNSHQALAAKRAGANSMLISFVGDDEIGKRVLDSLNNCKIDTRFIKTIKNQSTEINHQILDPKTKDYSLIRFPSPLSQYYTPDLVKTYEEWILKANAVILVSKQNKDFLESIIDFCYNNNIVTVLTISHEKFDITKNKDLETLKKVSFIAGNFNEAKSLTKKENEIDMLNLLPNLIITKGNKGVFFVDEYGNYAHEDAIKVDNVIETNGAGDTFIGVFITYYVRGIDKTICVRLGQCASSLEIQKMGVLGAIPEKNEIEKVYEKIYKKFKIV